MLVTGGSSGIGRASAIRLAQEGAHIAIAARNESAMSDVVDEIRQLGVQAIAVRTDVCDKDQCRNAVESTVAEFKQLDILLCSAGLSMRAPFLGSDLAAMEQVMRVNFFGTLYTTNFALPHIIKSRGSLVAVSSLTGRRGVPSYSIYGASKFAIEGLYASIRLELKRRGVHVGVISPGFVATPLRERVLGPDGQPWPQPPAPPFRVWPVERCVDTILRVIVKRRPRACLRWFTAPLLHMDQLIGNWIGDWILQRKFPECR